MGRHGVATVAREGIEHMGHENGRADARGLRLRRLPRLVPHESIPSDRSTGLLRRLNLVPLLPQLGHNIPVHVEAGPRTGVSEVWEVAQFGRGLGFPRPSHPIHDVFEVHG